MSHKVTLTCAMRLVVSYESQSHSNMDIELQVCVFRGGMTLDSGVIFSSWSVHVCACVCVYVCVCMNECCVRVYEYMYVCVFVCVCVHACISCTYVCVLWGCEHSKGEKINFKSHCRLIHQVNRIRTWSLGRGHCCL